MRRRGLVRRCSVAAAWRVVWEIRCSSIARGSGRFGERVLKSLLLIYLIGKVGRECKLSIANIIARSSV